MKKKGRSKVGVRMMKQGGGDTARQKEERGKLKRKKHLSVECENEEVWHN